ncbi:hypothetical protein V501_00566 [Pseudogymnoascus sp. VKM F-4519 (FW-2642)]|nr:hypothetical protein V501_00566 [Pseudogymnoascus sp. VKM F-4519 (FW-2642)]
MATEGRQATLERVLLSMEFLLDQLENGKKQYEQDPILSPCFNSAWKVMDKYYGLTERNAKSGFERWAKAKQQRYQPLLQDEYLKYCQLPVTPECDARGWWMEPAQRTAYPNLHKMAIDILSIPAMSAEPERLFSGAKITVTERRNRLGVDTIEYLECLKSCLAITDTPWAKD